MRATIIKAVNETLHRLSKITEKRAKEGCCPVCGTPPSAKGTVGTTYAPGENLMIRCSCCHVFYEGRMTEKDVLASKGDQK